MTPLEKYLKTYAATFDFSFPQKRFHHAVVLPCFGEEEKDVEAVLHTLRIAAQNASKKVLVILVINQRKNAKEEYKEKNRVLVEKWRTPGSFSLHEEESLTVCILNRTLSAYEFSEKEGVGLARKIGCDLAARLYFEKYILSPWVYTTDIDARVQSDYFFEEELSEDTALKLFPYEHAFDQKDGDALLLYDLWMRYYALSLKKANSPFAYSTLGSTFCIHAEAYGKVRGFPNRLAAEDFHLASKLSKVGKIVHSSLSSILLIGRASDRVPFGTGVGTNKYQGQLQTSQQIQFINPICFELLSNFQKEALSHLNEEKQMPTVDEQVNQALQLRSLLQTAKQTRTNTKDRELHFRTAFDALKTLRFVHLSEAKHPKVDYDVALRTLNENYDTRSKTLQEISKLMANDELCNA